MKTMKRLMALMLVFVLIMALSVTALAGTITVNSAVDGETYTAYKIFDVTYTGSGESDPHSYTVQAPWLSVVQGYLAETAHAGELTLTQIGTSGIYNVKNNSLKPADFAAYLMAHKPAGATSATGTAASGSATITVSTAGYYLVDSSFGALCALYTADDSFAFNEKNAKPTVAKLANGAASADASIGGTVPFTLTVNTGSEFATGLGTGNDADITLTDTMTNLTAVATSGNYVTITGWTKGTDYTETWNASTKTLTIVLKTSKLATLDPEEDIVISYSATLDATAVTTSTGNSNVVTLTYKHYTTSDTATVLTYEFDICKTDKDKKYISDANGAKFKLYSDSACLNEVKLFYDSTLGAYRPVVGSETAAEIDMSTSGRGAKAKIYGLAGTYYLKETVAPAGYNVLETAVTVDVTANNTNSDTATVGGSYTSGGVQVVNQSGVELPTTGGAGTTMLIVFGSVLFLATAIVLVTKKRMYNEG